MFKLMPPKHSGHNRFWLVLLVVLAYAAFTISSYGVTQGLSVTALTWAFFVFATPIADGGFVVAFPIRLITGFRMLYTQIIVWIIGAVLVGLFMVYSPVTFEKTSILMLFHAILTTPWPLWIILVLSAIGTFVSIKFDDDVVDVAGSIHKNSVLAKSRKKLYFDLGIFALTVVSYVVLLKITHTDIQFF